MWPKTIISAIKVLFLGEKSYLCTEMTSRRDKQKQQRAQLNKQLEPIAKKKSTSIADEAGKFCLDIAKLVFGGVLLASIMQQDIDFDSLFLTGLAVVLIFVVFGFYLIKKSKKEEAEK